MGMKFQGFGIDGYDNAKQKYVSHWRDTWGTGVMVQEGRCRDNHKVKTFIGKYEDPATGKTEKVKSVSTWKDDDTLVLEMFSMHEEIWVKTMKLTYTPRKE